MVESRFFLVKTIVVKQIFHCDAYFTCIIEYTHFRNDNLTVREMCIPDFVKTYPKIDHTIIRYKSNSLSVK